MEDSLELCRHGGRFLATLMTRDNKEDYDHLQASVRTNIIEDMQAYMDRAAKRTDIYKTLRWTLLDQIRTSCWTTPDEVCTYLRNAYFERLDHALGEVLA